MKQLGIRHWLLPALVLLLALPTAPPVEAQTTARSSADAYGYFRTVEGRSLLNSRQPEETRDIGINVPVLSGDAVQVGAGARLEAVLADGSVVRLEAGTELVFDELARSPDSPEQAVTRLLLLAGEAQIHVPETATEPEPPSIESKNSRVYLMRGGTYWVGVSSQDETILVVREGTAEVVTDDGSQLVHSGEEAVIAGAYRAQASIGRAGPERAIEIWAANLEAAAYAPTGPVEEELRYAAAPLERAGSWVYVEGRRAWRPRVRYGWRPFNDGYWVYTPSGLSWVAHEPWGWVTAHYGTWDYQPSFGWCWFPGAVYSPAWVYWYWGPSHAAWVPYGYYARHYTQRYGWNHGFRFGVYGWASGGWSVFADWTFCPLTYFGRRGGRYYHRSGADLARDRRALAVPRGVITTDTRGVGPRVWQRPFEVRQRLIERHQGRFVEGRRPGGDDLPDVTAFIARRRELPDQVRSVVRPLAAGEERPDLRQGIRARQEADSRDRARLSRIPLKPTAAGSERLRSPAVSERQRLELDERQVTRSTRSGADSPIRFERRPVSRPTEFERAPTSIYSRETTSGRESPAIRGSDSDSRSRVSGSERPTEFQRAPTSIYSRPSARDDTERPTSRDSGESPSFRQPSSREIDTRFRGRSSPDNESPPARGENETSAAPSSGSRGVSERATPPSRAPSATSSSSPPARRVVESARSRAPQSRASSSSSSSGQRIQSRSSSGSSRSSGSARAGASNRSSSSSKARSSNRSSSRTKKKKDE